jgi:hypothetical protein
MLGRCSFEVPDYKHGGFVRWWSRRGRTARYALDQNKKITLEQVTSLRGNLRPSVLRVAVLHPENAGGDVGRHMLDVLGVHRLRTPSRHEDLHRFVVIADGAAVQRTLHASPSRRGESLPDSALVRCRA